MKTRRCTDVSQVAEHPGVLVRDVIASANGALRFAMRLFELAPGASTTPHTHWWEHGVFVLSGQGKIIGDGEEAVMEEGTVIFTSPDELHSFVNTGSVLLRYILINPLQR